MVQCNVGGADRLERTFHGVAFIVIAVFLVNGAWQYVLGAYGLIRLLTGIFAFCPAYIPLKYSTRTDH